MKYVDYKKIINEIAKAGKELKTIKIYYPKTETSPAGWREIEPYSFATDIGPEGEHMVFGKDRIAPGHIFNGYTINSNDSHCDSFIIGKIKNTRITNNKFSPRNNWKVEF